MSYTKQRGGIILVGPLADRPLASVGAYWYLATDEDGGTLYHSDGSMWTQAAAGVSATGGVTFGSPAVVLGTVAGAGSIDEAIRRDSTIVAFDATAPSTQAFGDSAAAGSAAVAARRDHKHAMPAAPTSVSGNAGTATALQTGRAIDGQTFDGTADITVIAPGTHAASSKTTPVDNDELALVDSAASNVLKKLLWSNLKATLKAYFDTLYASASGSAPIGTPELIYRYTVTGSDKTSIDTGADTADAGSNVWSGGDVLEVYLYTRTDEAVVNSNVNVVLNNDTSSIYDRQTQYGNSTTSAAAYSGAQGKWLWGTRGASSAAGFFGTSKIEIPNYAGTVGHKCGTCWNNYIETTGANSEQDVHGLQYRSTSAITRIAVAADAAGKKLKVGSVLYVYKRRNA